MVSNQRRRDRTNASARERAAALRAAQARAHRRRRTLGVGVGAGVVVAAVGGGITLAVVSSHPRADTPPPQGATAAAANAAASQPPWPRPADTTRRAAAVGLRVAAAEGTAAHFHAHLDVLVDGKAVTVPAGLGLGDSAAGLAELHTHDTSGVLHVEAPTGGRAYSLGQLFAEWNVRLTPGQLGGLTAAGGRTLTTYVDGAPATGNPAGTVIKAHQEIVLVFGSGSPTVPARYDFPPGE